MDVQKAKKYDQIEKDLIKYFKEKQSLEDRNVEIKQKSFEPITSAIGKIEGKISNVLDQNTNLMNLVPFVNNIANVSVPESSYYSEENPLKQIQLNYNDDVIPSSTPIKANIIDLTLDQLEESKRINPKELDKNIIQKIYGPISSKYLADIHDRDKIFGIYWDKSQNKFKIGDTFVEVSYDDIFIKNQLYKGSEGLWKLLTYKDSPNKNEYNQEDLESYSKILTITNAMFQNNDFSSKKPKSSRSDKWMNLVSNIWKSKNNIEGSGVRKYIPNSKIEYRFIDDFNKLYSLMNYIYAQEKAGHNNFLNEKKAISDLLLNKLNETIEKPEGIKYLIRLWPSIQNILDKEGSGIINDLINNLPFELHVPSYNFLGPGTKLDMRLKRGDKGINKLDEAAKEHDIFYKNHKDVESRHIADKLLENKAVDRIISKDADFLERLVAIPTAGTMFIKRKLGMGLDPELKFNI